MSKNYENAKSNDNFFDKNTDPKQKLLGLLNRKIIDIPKNNNFFSARHTPSFTLYTFLAFYPFSDTFLGFTHFFTLYTFSNTFLRCTKISQYTHFWAHLYVAPVFSVLSTFPNKIFRLCLTSHAFPLLHKKLSTFSDEKNIYTQTLYTGGKSQTN